MAIGVRWPKKLIRMALVNAVNYCKSYNKQKIFCVGRNKTGTTSLEAALGELGFVVGHQPTAEHLAHRHYFAGNFRALMTYCRCGQVFQDVPFSWPETYKHLDWAFPESKFILTVRDDSEQWYRSITRFHAKKFGSAGAVPTSDELKAAGYRRKGFMYNTVKVHGTSDSDPYNKAQLKAHYEQHNTQVIQYFRNRPDQLLVLNIASDDGYQRLIDFLGERSSQTTFPWKNQT